MDAVVEYVEVPMPAKWINGPDGMAAAPTVGVTVIAVVPGVPDALHPVVATPMVADPL